MMKYKAAIRWIVIAAGLAFLSACGIGQPMDIPVPESQITPKAGLFSDDTGEYVIYRKQ
jgi:predicted small lipoprotein YifL